MDGYVEDTAGTALTDRTCRAEFPLFLVVGSNPSSSHDGRHVAHECASSQFEGGNQVTGICVTEVLTRMTELVSVSSAGEGSALGAWNAEISANGRYVAFESDAANLVAGDENGRSDVFVHDRATGVTERVSVGSNGEEGNGDASLPSISEDGRYVAFESLADNLVPGDTNTQSDVFLRDRTTGETERIALRGEAPAITPDGAFVAVGPWYESGQRHVAVFERETLAFEIASQSTSGTLASNQSSRPAIAADGKRVAFQSDAINLVPGDTNGRADIFLRDLGAGTTTRVSVTSAGEQASSDSSWPSIAADGSAVVFRTAAQLVPADTNSRAEAYHYAVATGAITRVSLDFDGTTPIETSRAVVSGDGRFVIYDGSRGIYVNELP